VRGTKPSKTMARRSYGVALLLLFGWLAAGCGSGTGGAIPAPKGLPAFYAVPQPLPPTAGTLLKYERVGAPGLDGTVYRVMYVSQSVGGRPVATTGLVIAPRRPAPGGGYPVVSWAHGTNGMADICAPSLQPIPAVPLVNALLERGWEITATDYQGEGTPGLMPYLVGTAAAQDTINIVRAARHLPAAHAGNRYVVWGHSEGGQTAMFALHIGRRYAPELHMLGVVAGAPPSQLWAIYGALRNSPFRYYLLMAAGGFNAAYGNTQAPLQEVLTPKGIGLLPVLDQGCAGYVASKVGATPLSELVKADPSTVPAWRRLVTANDPGSFTTPSPVPLLIIQGGADEQIPVISSAILANHLCGVGQDLERWIYPGQSHAGVIAPSAADMIRWIADRFAGDPNPDPYQPQGMAGIQITTCPS
jgi:pimeloyl-ACP methyl ester carboxylesterase